jgi:hypothetical protein
MRVNAVPVLTDDALLDLFLYPPFIHWSLVIGAKGVRMHPALLKDA